MITPEYLKWRERGFNNQYPVRYPVGFENRTRCLYSLLDGKKLDYITARKEIYCKEYCRLIKQQPKFALLKRIIAKGINILIIELDVAPVIEDDQYTMLINEKNIKQYLYDKRYAFGHGYVLACALLDKEEWLL